MHLAIQTSNGRTPWKAILMVLLVSAIGASSAVADTTITYQGQLKQSGTPFTGTADLEFRLFDQLNGGTQVGSTLSRAAWPVEEGLFQVELDFGLGAFTDQVRWLEIRVDGSTLVPRQAVRPSPMALFALAGNEGPPGPAGSTGPPGDSHWQLNGSTTYYTAGPVGIGLATPSPSYALEVGGASRIRHNSSIGLPHLYLIEEENDYARLNFLSLGGSRFWAIAARSGDADANTGQLNIFNSTDGDLLSVRGNGPVGIGLTNPPARLSVRSDNQWNPGIGNGRGDFYVGNGAVGLSVGVSLAGAGTGVTRLWTNGGTEHLFLGSAAYGTSLSVLPGQIGVNNTNPGNTLDVDGGIRIRTLAHAGPSNRNVVITPNGDLATTAPAAAERFFSLPPNAFQPRDDATPHFSGQTAYINFSSGTLLAPVYVPHGATIREWRIWYVDNDSSNISFALCRRRHLFTGCLLLARLESAGSSGALRQLATPAGFSHTVDQSDGGYYISAFNSNWAGSATAIHSMQLRYDPP